MISFDVGIYEAIFLSAMGAAFYAAEVAIINYVITKIKEGRKKRYNPYRAFRLHVKDIRSRAKGDL